MKKPDNLMRKSVAKEYLRNLIYGFEKSRILFTAEELGIFKVLADGEKSSQDVASICEIDHRACDRLLNALCAIGLLVKRNELFENHPVMKRYLEPDSPSYMTNIKHMGHLWESWHYLTDAVKTGTAPDLECLNQRCEKWLDAFIAAMHWRAIYMAPIVSSLITIDPFSKVLDLGCGSGAYSMEFVKTKPEILVTAYDYKEVLPFTKKYLDSFSAKNKIELVEGDFFVDDIGKGYDVVFISSIIHSYSIWENMDLIKKVYYALKPGGKIIIHDYIIGDDRTSPEDAALFALNMLVNTKSGDTYIYTDVWLMLQEAWFRDIHRIDTEKGTSLIIGTR